MSNSSPAQPIPDPAKDPEASKALGGDSVTGEAGGRRDIDDDSVNGSQNLEQRVAPNPFKDADRAQHNSH
ncbi:MAG TPA: hypothetical protein VF649_12495 [Sphingomonas sp.]|jgi:hypothetical protein|uniref:hypothetical protein n=1 Tax=Sphingomonas sp. TaxID=28214 RepID=UPI002ED81559